MRYNKTETIGLIEANSAVTKKLDWVFRDQPLVDVGIDAIIEESINGDPTGKFLAAQIKSGEGNFSINSQRLVLYVSNVHYNYWTNLNIPIILICYLPTTDKCYWQQISRKTLIKTPTRWKINIPLKNLLDAKSKPRLQNILAPAIESDIFHDIYRLEIHTEASFHLGALIETIPCVLRINDLLKEGGEFTNAFSEKLPDIMRLGYAGNSPLVTGLVKQLSRHQAFTARRFELEIELFSKAFPEELLIFESILYSAVANDIELPSDLVASINSLPANIDIALQGIQNLKNTTSKIKTAYPFLNESISRLDTAVGKILTEYAAAKQLVLNLNNGKLADHL